MLAADATNIAALFSSEGRKESYPSARPLGEVCGVSALMTCRFAHILLAIAVCSNFQYVLYINRIGSITERYCAWKRAATSDYTPHLYLITVIVNLHLLCMQHPLIFFNLRTIMNQFQQAGQLMSKLTPDRLWRGCVRGRYRKHVVAR